ncbi:hypothetical protein NDU88_010626 [Pleurodeles waltl]|uniref:Uncharacterized protein n=1 Tax=Pleurodeles waltl TaxID=8319 RepID=A0AAV7PW97_PLEWA|nr:hypothetical protein NDU88_010626 [Pleurodeles waltl]
MQPSGRGVESGRVLQIISRPFRPSVRMLAPFLGIGGILWVRVEKEAWMEDKEVWSEAFNAAAGRADTSWDEICLAVARLFHRFGSTVKVGAGWEVMDTDSVGHKKEETPSVFIFEEGQLFK